MSESKASSRIWMGTLTFKPEVAFQIQWRAEEAAYKRGVKWHELDEGAKFIAVQAEAGRDVTLWLKRLRKAGHRFRYVVTCEAHVSGAPHFHVIFHELATAIGKRDLQSSWIAGFSKFKLIPQGDEGRAVRYVTKYVAKNGAARIRASIRYGVADDLNSELVQNSVGSLDDKGVIQSPLTPQSIFQFLYGSDPKGLNCKVETVGDCSLDGIVDVAGKGGAP